MEMYKLHLLLNDEIIYYNYLFSETDSPKFASFTLCRWSRIELFLKYFSWKNCPDILHYFWFFLGMYSLLIFVSYYICTEKNPMNSYNKLNLADCFLLSHNLPLFNKENSRQTVDFKNGT